MLVLLAYSKFKQVRALECSQLVAALAIGDLISCLGSITLGVSKLEIALFDDYDYTRLYCVATACVVQVGLEISQLMTASIAVDRFMALTSAVSDVSNDIFLLFNALIGPAIAGIY
uniref:G-protein coupled receptors family 1 profile domain-containing protein n=1 Tax=Plectus sambesii TaxID=2011161 RepID=A0A914XBS1_9BILA